MMAENRFKKYVAPTGSGVVINDPSADREAAEAAERLRIAQAQLGISQQNANTSAANAAVTAANANKPPQGFEYGPNGLQFIPGGPADPAVIAAAEVSKANAKASAKVVGADPDRPAQILTALENIRQLRDLAKQSLAVGRTSEWASGLPLVGPLLGQNRADVEGSLKMVQGDLIQQQIARLSQINGGNGVASIANSETEAARMAASIANLDPNQNPEQFQIGLDRAEAYYRRQLDQMKADSGVAAPAMTAAGAGATEQSLPIPAEMQAEHMAYLRANWGKLDPQAYAQFRTDLDGKYGFGSNTEEYAASADPLNQRAAQGGTPDSAFIPPVTVPLTEEEQGANDLASSTAGRGIAAFANGVGAGAVTALAPEQMALMREESSGEMFAGDLAGSFFGAGALGKGLGFGAKFLGPKASGVLSNPMTAEAVYGGLYGGNEGGPVGVVTGVGGAWLGNKVGNRIGQQFGRRAAGPDPLSAGERAIQTSVTDVDPVIAALTQADQLGVPMTLADASPELGSLAGSATRFSPTTAGQARTVMAQRNQGQVDRLASAVERDLGPVTNIPQRSADLSAQAKAAAGPLYDAAYAAPGIEDLDLSDLMGRPSMKKALANARRIALEEGRNPDELGFVLNDAGEVTVPMAGRYVEARGPQPAGGIASIHQMGANAPADLATFVRQNGGLRDSGGELKFIGADNKARRGVAMAGQDSKYGRLVDNERGRTFDDMAEAAWEAGYFGPPETTPRPTTTDFLAALEDTYTGSRRQFSIYDDDLVAQYDAAEENLGMWRNAEGEMIDTSQPVGMDEVPFAPMDAFGSVQGVAPTWQTLDYVKRGLDDVVESYRDKTTGKLVLDTEGKAVNDTLRTFISRVDDANPAYAEARKVYAGPMQERDFLQRGQKAIGARPDQLGVDMAGLTPEQTAQMRLGYQSELMTRAGDVRNNGNPFAQLNTPNTEGRLNTLYNGAEEADIARLLSQRDLELQLAGSANRLVGNSATAERSVADEFFKQAPTGIGGDVAQGVVESALMGGPWLTAGKRIGDRLWKDKREAAALAANRSLADELGPILLNDVPTDAAAALTDIGGRAAAYDPVLEALLEKYGARIGHAGALTGAITGGGIPR